MNDTCWGINNEGQLSFDYYHEDTDTLDGANVYNGQNSTLWCNFREAFADEIQETYQKLRGDGLITYDILEEQFITKGSDKWSESVFNEDGEFKYISMVKSDNDASNLPFARGDGEQHFRYFVENRLNYCDSKWYATDYANDYVSLRIYTPSTWAGVEPNADITVVPYSNMYAGVRYKANGTLYQERVEHGEEITFEAPNETFNDTETAIYGASQLSSLGDLAPLYCGTVNVAKATKLTEIKIGDGTEGYSNNNLKELSVGTNKLLKKIDIQNCPSFTSALGLSGCQNIEEIYAKGSGITGVELADSGYLKIVQLPGTIANLTMKNQEYIEEFSMEGYSALKTLHVENCPAVNTLDIIDKAANLERVRVTGVDWNYPDTSFLYELMDRKLAGIDETGANTDTMWVDGTCHIENLTGAEYAEIKAMYPYLTITYDTLTSQLIYMSEDGQTELTRQTITNGGNGTDPVTAGTIETPTKESTAQYNFTFNGWSLTPGGAANDNALLRVEADRYVYAAFANELRYYTVNFYIDGVVKETYSIPYGGTATFAGDTTHPTDPDIYEFVEWKPSPANITGDTNCHAQYYDKREIQDDWTTIATNVKKGTATSKYAIGSYKNVEINYEDGTSETIPMEVIAHNHDELGDGIKKWEEVDYAIPFNPNGSLPIEYNNALHVFLGNSHYKYDGTTWTSDASTLPYDLTNSKIVLYNNEVHVLGGTNGVTSHYKYNGSTWTSVSTLPAEFSYINAVVCNNAIHVIGTNGHYKWNGSAWSSLSTPTFSFGGGTFVTYNNEICVLGGNYTDTSRNMYKYDATNDTWVKGVEMPRQAYMNFVVVYYDRIHILGDSINGDAYYTWDGLEWSEITHLNINTLRGMGFVFRNEINIANAKTHWKWSTASWVKSEIPNGVAWKCKTIEYKSDLYILGDQFSSKIRKWNGEKWETLNTELPIKPNDAVVYNDELHLFNGTAHHKWDGTTWTEVSTIPISFGGIAVVWNDKIHLLGGDTNHYAWDGTTWTSVSTLPCSVSWGNFGANAVVYNNELYAIISTGNYVTINFRLYKLDGTKWTEVSIPPVLFRSSAMVVYDNKIHVIGSNNGAASNVHYTWDGSNWDNESILPFNHTGGAKTTGLYRGKLYIATNSDNVYFYENPKATLTFFAKNSLKDNIAINKQKKTYNGYTSYTAGGWALSDANIYYNETIYNALPVDLQSAIKVVNKLSDTGYEDRNIIKSPDKCWMASIEEVGLTQNVVLGQGSQYPVFTDAFSRYRYKVGETKTASWWLRSTVLAWAEGNYYVNMGNTGQNSSNQYYSVVFGFCI